MGVTRELRDQMELTSGGVAESHDEGTGVLVFGCKTWIPTLLWLHLLIQTWRWVGKMEEGTIHYLIFWDLLVNQCIPWDLTGHSYMFSFLKWASQVALVVKNLPANAGDIRDAGLILGGGHGNPLPYSCLEDPMDPMDPGAIVHRVAKSQTWLKGLSTHMPSYSVYFPKCI